MSASHPCHGRPGSNVPTSVGIPPDAGIQPTIDHNNRNFQENFVIAGSSGSRRDLWWGRTDSSCPQSAEKNTAVDDGAGVSEVDLISPAFRVALSIADMREPCSDAAFSSNAVKICVVTARGSKSARIPSSLGS